MSRYTWIVVAGFAIGVGFGVGMGATVDRRAPQIVAMVAPDALGAEAAIAEAERIVRVNDTSTCGATRALDHVDGAARASAIAGRVLDPDGRPVAGARVFARAVNAPSLDLSRGALTDAEGRFRLDGLDTGVYYVVALHPAHGPGGSDLVRLRGASTVEVTVALDADTISA